MNRRDFIKSSSFTVAGGTLLANIPLGATGLWSANRSRHVVLCIVAGIAYTDFPKLIPDAVLPRGELCPGIKYNGYAAGHRIALESILHGRYLRENESGQMPLAHSPLLQCPGKKTYLLTSDRDFLTGHHGSENIPHLYAADNRNRHHDQASKSAYTLKSVSAKHGSTAAAIHNKIIGMQGIRHRETDTFSEDAFIAEAASKICADESPTLLAAHFMGADAAHHSPGLAQNNIRHIREGLRRIWDSVEANHQMKDQTLFIVCADFGRNGYPNSLRDEHGLWGSDHSVTDPNTRQTGCFLASSGGHEHGIGTGIEESIDMSAYIRQYLNPGSEKFAAPPINSSKF